MNEIKRTMKKAIPGLLLSTLIITGTLFQIPGSSLEAADTCSTACERYVECAPEIMKTNPSAQQKKTLMQGCMNSCKNPKLKKGIIACYTKNKDQCTVFFQCLVSAGQKM
jgi:Cys-rich protein (TIGR04453 family)